MLLQLSILVFVTNVMMCDLGHAELVLQLCIRIFGRPPLNFLPFLLLFLLIASLASSLELLNFLA